MTYLVTWIFVYNSHRRDWSVVFVLVFYMLRLGYLGIEFNKYSYEIFGGVQME